MPSGKTHEKINFFVLFVAAIACANGMLYLFFGQKIGAVGSCFLAAYLFGTVWLGPDLDTKSNNYYRWGPLRFIWIPYRKLIPHRSFWSHGIVAGDALRVVYLGAASVAVYALIALSLHLDTRNIASRVSGNVKIWHPHIITFFIGLCFSSLLHILADRASTGVKRFNRKFASAKKRSKKSGLFKR